MQDVGSSGAVRSALGDLTAVGLSAAVCSDGNAVAAVGLKRVSSAFLLGNGLGRFRKALMEEGTWVTCKQMRCCIARIIAPLASCSHVNKVNAVAVRRDSTKKKKMLVIHLYSSERQVTRGQASSLTR